MLEVRPRLDRLAVGGRVVQRQHDGATRRHSDRRRSLSAGIGVAV